ncbi:MAG: caspase family protein [Myxococcota bacterium]|jgi:hypothetical protein|nr:caspase family protein [Myxococcota bacterium]
METSKIVILCTALVGLLATTTPVWGQPSPKSKASFALLVGSNRAGAGQEPLRYAVDDARRLADVLIEVGVYDEERVRVLIDPGSDELLVALEALQEGLADAAQQGDETVVLFYYSGHARSQALNLGDDELPLSELRQTLEALPAKVKIAVIDACQSGAVSGIKGVAPAADFSHNSVSGLDVAGLAVLASSAASELSQESSQLGGSYFTHHLTVGLRGAADQNRDGLVSLAEAYTYAYNRTLVATAATAVGKQHVTLETEMKGKGEMILSRPGGSGSALSLPFGLSGELLVHRESDDVVMAEVHKAAGSSMRLAMPPSRYSAIVRQGDRAMRCAVQIAPKSTTDLVLDDCAPLRLRKTTTKGEIAEKAPAETLALEVMFGLSRRWDDDFSQTMRDFGFENGNVFFPKLQPMLAVSLAWQFAPHLSLVLTGSNLDTLTYNWPQWGESDTTEAKKYSLAAARLALQLRGSLAVRRWFVLFAQAGVGPTLAWTTFNESSAEPSVGEDPLTRDYREYHYGYNLTASIGLQLMPWRHVGFALQGEYIYAPTAKNEMGQVHDSGGFNTSLGLRGAF